MTNNSPSQEPDIISCESEPIHIIGSVQPHAYLLAFDSKNEILTYASDNLTDLTDEADLLGKTLADIDTLITGPQGVLKSLWNMQKHATFGSELEHYKTTIRDQAFNILPKKVGEHILFEIEPRHSDQTTVASQAMLGEMLIKINIQQNDHSALFNYVAENVRNLIEFDRVMVYKFWEDWHGEVIAESKIDELESFLGLHYPASDVPAQARALFIQSPVRIIADIDAQQSAIRSRLDAPLDLSEVHSRSSSPIHIEYLQNMGVKASFSISIIVEGKLWGLIACHNNTPKYLDFERRKAAYMISSFLSRLVEMKDKTVDQQLRNEYLDTISQLDEQVREAWDVSKGLTRDTTNILHLFDCQGAAVVHEDEISTLGETPNRDQILQIAAWLQEHKPSDTIFATTNISHHIPGLENIASICSGILSIGISPQLRNYVLWFRPEHLSEVSWGGKDEKGLVPVGENKYRLSPRKSFAKWSEQVSHSSKPWTHMEKEAAYRLKEKIISFNQLKSNEINRLNEKLTIAYDDLDAFSYTLSHDLKTPLATVNGYLELLEEELDDTYPLLNKVKENTSLMRDMISNILAYSRLGREPLKKSLVEAAPIFEDIRKQIETTRGFTNLHINVDNDTSLMGNRIMLYQVFLNLIENAVKYSDPAKESVVNVNVEDKTDHYIFSVQDNGIGIHLDHYDKIFGIFKRINDRSDIDGAGVGLSIAQKIVNQHGGRIWLDSEIGVGSTFYVTLNKE